jgi:hypothetical protein
MFVKAEDQIREADPSFQGGFQTISMQAARLQLTISRLKLSRRVFNDKRKQLSQALRSWRSKNPGQTIRGVGTSRGHKNMREYRSGKKRSLPARATKAQLSPKSNKVKIQFEKRDYKLRNQLVGIGLLDDILEDCETVLTLRLKDCNTLEKIGKKLERGIFDVEDGEKLAMAYKEVVDGSMELKAINEMLDELPKLS